MSVTFSKSFIYGQVIFWSAAGLAIAVFLGYQLYREFDRSPYKVNLESYLKPPQNTLLNKFNAPKDSVVISGKLITVNLINKTIDPIFNDLPVDLKPESPEQVKTVLWIQCKPEISFQKYVDGTNAYNNVCDLTFIDFVNNKYIWKDSVTVSPPLSKNKGSDKSVLDPSSRILEYLQSIPHQN